jgi:SAM-dependent MidA family methyltransferase
MRDEFASVTHNTALAQRLVAEIDAAGPMSFARFMELALYHPTLGYYRSGVRRIGGRGDYVTSPYLSPIFGGIVGRQIAEMWQRLDRPDAFDLVEMGAGDGRLVRDIVTWAGRTNPPFAAAVRVTLVEPDPATRETQRRALSHLEMSPIWVERLESVPPASISGVVLSNELIDSFPVRLFTVRGANPYEIAVTHDAIRLIETVREAPADDLPAAVAAHTDRLPDGARFEVNEAAAAWMRVVAGRLVRGFVLTFDYGYTRARLYAPWRTQGTLMAFYRHAVSPDPLAHPGEQDLTAHVDFTTLAETGREHGLTVAGFTAQREFLTALGINDAVAAPGLTLEERLARRRAVLALTDPAGLGRVRALAQARGVEHAELSGFAGPPPTHDALR